jgi:hypothetical protein
MDGVVTNVARMYFLTNGNNTTRKASMYQLDHFPASANAAPHMLLEAAWRQIRAFARAEVNFFGMPITLWSHAFVVTRSSFCKLVMLEMMVRPK